MIHGSKVNQVSDVPSQGTSSGKNLKVQGKAFKKSATTGNLKKDRACFNCGKKGHYSRECRSKKKNAGSGKGKGEALMVETENDDFVAMVTELHMASVAVSDDWWLDSGATIHVCNNKSLFKTYVVDALEEVLMGNHVAAKVLGKGAWNSISHLVENSPS